MRGKIVAQMLEEGGGRGVFLFPQCFPDFRVVLCLARLDQPNVYIYIYTYEIAKQMSAVPFER